MPYLRRVTSFKVVAYANMQRCQCPHSGLGGLKKASYHLICVI
jgi:hypothetical protein